jgi:serine/threonine-protein kinase
MKHVRDTPRPLPSDIPPTVRAIVDRALAKDPSARWPTAAAMAAIARQAASSLTTQVQQPVNGAVSVANGHHPSPPTMNRPQSGSPVGNRPYSGAPTSGQPGPQAQSRPPYPPVQGPVSGGQARGAASVPPQQQMPQRMPAQKADNGGGRQVLIVLAVVLALLVLLCAGVISFLLRQGNTTWKLGAPAHATSVRTAVAAETLSSASYRLTQQVGGSAGLDYASEGRLTL